MDIFASRPFSDRTVEALLAGRPVPDELALSGAVARLRAAADQPVAAASPALAAMLEQGCTPGPVRAPSPWRGWGPRAAVVVAAGLGGLLTAASANALPPTVQGVVADVVGAVTTFELPRGDHPTAPSVPTVSSTDTPTATPTSAPTSTPAATPAAPAPARTERPTPSSSRLPVPIPSAAEDGDNERGSSGGGGSGQPTDDGSTEPAPQDRQQDPPDTDEQVVSNGEDTPAARPAEVGAGRGPVGGEPRGGEADPPDDPAAADSPQD